MMPRLLQALGVVAACTALLGAGGHAAGRDGGVAAQSPLAACEAASEEESVRCYAAALAGMAGERGLEPTLADVDRHRQRSARFAQQCHMALHPLGERDGRRLARGSGELPSLTPRSFCHEGYVHGLTIAYLQRASTLQLVRRGRELCGVGDVATAWSCVHSLGHVYAQRGDLRMDASARLCLDAVDAGGAWRMPFSQQTMLGSCVKGALMELQIAAERDRSRSFERHRVCAEVAPRARLACYSFLSMGVDDRADVLAPARTCLAHAPAGSMRQACVKVWARSLRDHDACDALPNQSLARVCRHEARSAPLYDVRRESLA